MSSFVSFNTIIFFASLNSIVQYSLVIMCRSLHPECADNSSSHRVRSRSIQFKFAPQKFRQLYKKETKKKTKQKNLNNSRQFETRMKNHTHIREAP